MTGKQAATGFVRARIDKGTKAEAEAVLEKIGLNASDAVRMFYRQIILRNGLPFSPNIPNAETRKALKSKNISKGYKNAGEMFDDILGTDWRDA